MNQNLKKIRAFSDEILLDKLVNLSLNNNIEYIYYKKQLLSRLLKYKKQIDNIKTILNK